MIFNHYTSVHITSSWLFSRAVQLNANRLECTPLLNKKKSTIRSRSHTGNEHIYHNDHGENFRIENGKNTI